jgi:hypothetical protein
MMSRSIEVVTAKRMLDSPIQPLKENRVRTSREGRPRPEGRQDPEAQDQPGRQGGDPGDDEQDDDAGEPVAQGDADKGQNVEQNVGRHLDGIDQVEPLGGFENPAEGGADEHDRQRQANETQGQDGLADEALGDVEHPPDDERREQVGEGRRQEADRRLHQDGGPKVTGEFLGFVPPQGVGDVLRRRPAQAQVEQPEIAEDDPDQGQDAEPVVPQGPDDQRNGDEPDGQGDNEAEEVQGRVAEEGSVTDVHERKARLVSAGYRHWIKRRTSRRFSRTLDRLLRMSAWPHYNRTIGR